MEPMGRPSKYPAEFRERAVRMVFEHAPEHPSQWAAIRSVANVSSITDARSEYSQSFGYDALDRLTDVSGYMGMSFGYDALGNRTSKGSTNYQYDPNTLRQTQSTGAEADFSIQYDANGNRT